MSTEPKPVDRIHPNIGRTMTRHDDMPGAIVSQAGEHYIIRWQDGRETPVKVETLAAADRAHLADMGRRVPVKQPVKAAAAPARASPTADMIHKIVFANASGMKDLKTRAREALAEMDLIRAGVKPAPLTATETARILETCRNADPVHLSAAEHAKILARLQGGSEDGKPTYDEQVAAHVERLRPSK